MPYADFFAATEGKQKTSVAAKTASARKGE
jgi:hypothetical protein